MPKALASVSARRLPNVTLPTVFDAAAYVAELRAAGFSVSLTGNATRPIIIGNPDGFGDEHDRIQEKWGPSRKRTPDWLDQVRRVVEAESPAKAKAARARIKAKPTKQEATPQATEPLYDVLPPDLPDVYGMQVDGDCLAPSIAHGTVAVVSKTEAPKAGDFVCVWFKPEFVQPGHHQAIIKRMVMDVPPWVKSFPYNDHPESDVKAIVIIEMFNPRQQMHICCDQLLAIHKVTGIQRREEG